ncbi:LrgB family protein [Afifella marina]|uniref:TIGR00659 family protein n=1 Tax=Afifella marina DSM 2698 TaxID=1120955 RepID=A0A1G5N332_AFIMA|nr:LrgB family protein [Afifella marina]MBK1622292.1 LrgB family protein [Afifella marina DSM 2698]MBK1626994.1 LrgB family protein [Afifella marina]MBK5919076.1 murein hydrolase effector protein LrgB [Afifella marina]RAI20188.1 murein hydrolase effector protein LrgB [Afifella marina DSM 2698]SCZ31090.1 TIGR00659 family protein [Afifella marina DSM 2698]
MPSSSEILLHGLFWSALTIGTYFLAKRIYLRWRQPFLMPLAITPALLILIVVTADETYRDYIRSTGWLVSLLGPAMVAFAVPIYEQRALIARHWPVLVVGMLAGTATAILSGWTFASLVGLDDALRLSLLPRSVSTPFAMVVSSDIGGAPDLTAVFVVLTGVFGAILGELMLTILPVKSALARGALFGVAAHASGTAKAHEIGHEEGSVAGLVMVLVGLLNVLVAPLIAHGLPYL